MRTGAIQSDAFPSDEKDNLTKENRSYIPEEAIHISEEARNPLVKDENGNEVHAKTLAKNTDPYAEDRISIEPTEGRGNEVPDENVMPG